LRGDIRDNVPPVQILGGRVPPCPIEIDAPVNGHGAWYPMMPLDLCSGVF